MVISDDNPRYVSRLTRSTLGLVLAGGRGSRGPSRASSR